MGASLHRLLLHVYRALPTPARRWVVRVLAPGYTVGAICRIERPTDGAVLLVRQAYRSAWGIPGGLLQRGEEPADAARREVLEEVGLEIELLGEPRVVVDVDPRRVDLVFRARPAQGADIGSLTPTSPEIVAVSWFRLDELPALQHETRSAFAALDRLPASGDGEAA